MPTITIKIDVVSLEEFSALDAIVRDILRLADIPATVLGRYNDTEVN